MSQRPTSLVITDEDRLFIQELFNYFDYFSTIIKTDPKFIKYYHHYGPTFQLVNHETKLQYIYFVRQIFFKVYNVNYKHLKLNREPFALAIFKASLYFENPILRPVLAELIFELSVEFFRSTSNEVYNRSTLIFDKLVAPLGLYDISSIYGYASKISSMFTNEIYLLAESLREVSSYYKDYLEVDLRTLVSTVIVRNFLKAEKTSITKENFTTCSKYIIDRLYSVEAQKIEILQMMLYFAEDFLAPDFLSAMYPPVQEMCDYIDLFLDDNPTESALMDDIFGSDYNEDPSSTHLNQAI